VPAPSDRAPEVLHAEVGVSSGARELGALALRWWWLILLCGVIAGGTAYIVTRDQKPAYEASTTLIVGRSLEAGSTLDPREVQSNELLAQTYADIARRQPVLQGVVDTLELEIGWRTLRERVRANPVESTQLLEIVAESRSPGEAEAIADETARQLIKLQSEAGLESEQRRFVSDQLQDLSQKIVEAQQQVDGLESRLSGTVSDEERQSLRDQISALQQQISDWQATYADFLANAQPTSDTLAVVESARATSRPVRASVALNTVVAAILGVLIALGTAALWERSVSTFKSAGDVSRELGLPFLGGVRSTTRGRWANPVNGPIVPPSPPADDYRILRSSIESLSLARPIRSILVTSPSERDSRTTTVSNLGIVMAQAGTRTVLIDADIRQPMLHDIFGVPESPGLTDYLKSGSQITEALKPTSVENLQILTTGSPVSNPSELLDSPGMSRLLELLQPVADVVILDGPSPLHFSDAVLLSKHVDGVLLVLTAGRTRRDAAQSSVMLLERAGAKLLGGVLHAVPNQIASDGYIPGHRPAEPQ
jgi:capsular exopolysaccharide synthesis family protein